MRAYSNFEIPKALGGRQQTMKRKKTLVRAVAVGVVILMALSCIPVVSFAGSTGHIWLNAIPSAKAKGGGWKAGGWVTWGNYTPDGTITFILTVENRGKEDLLDLRIAMCIHGPDDPPPETTADDFVYIDIEGSTHYLGDFGSTEYNPFDEWFGGRHHVYVGTDAIWDIYYHDEVVESGETAYLYVNVQLGPDPSDDFEIHFDAFDMLTEYKTPNGHDLTLISWAQMEPPEPEKEPPVAIIVGGEERIVYEGDLVTFDGSPSYDPDGYIVSYEWDFDADVDSDGDGNPANDVDATGPIVTFTWYDDYESDVKLTVTDNDGLTDYAWQHVFVLNLDPEIEFEGAFIEFELSLRVAGEKWHNVELMVVTNYDAETGMWDEEIGVLEVERWPGPPDDNPSSGSSLLVSADISGEDTYTAIITYDPYPDDGDAILGDQPINGQLWGGNPVWLIATFPDGTVCKKHHTFNVQQSIKRDSDHWNHVEPWIVPLHVGAVVGAPIKFVATATEPGSDDLTFTWDWGDMTSDTIVYLYDPVTLRPNTTADPAYPPGSPYEPYGAPWDPYYPMGGGQYPPLSVTDMTYHTYSYEGTFTVTLTVTDDDGGSDTYTLDIEVGGEFGGC
jgi:hypothetical protein